jgi:hypothetical protein
LRAWRLRSDPSKAADVRKVRGRRDHCRHRQVRQRLRVHGCRDRLRVRAREGGGRAGGLMRAGSQRCETPRHVRRQTRHDGRLPRSHEDP